MMTARVLTTILAAAWLAAAAPGKISKDLSGVDPAATLDVIVQFRNGGTDAEVEKVRQHGGQQKKKLKQVKAASFRIPAGQLDRLANQPEIEFISKDRTVRSHFG